MFCERLKYARKSSGLTQAGVAALVFISQQAYACYETGVATPNPETLAAIAKVLNVSTDYLCGFNYLLPKTDSEQQIMQFLFGTAEGVTPQMLQQVRMYAHAILQEKA